MSEIIEKARQGKKHVGKTTAKVNAVGLYEVKIGKEKKAFGLNVRALEVKFDRSKACVGCPFLGTVNCADFACLPFQRKDKKQITFIEV